MSSKVRKKEKLLTSSAAQAKTLIVTVLAVFARKFKKCVLALKNRRLEYCNRRRLRRRRLFHLRYNLGWKSSLTASSYKTSARTLSTFRVLLRLAQVFGSFPIKNLCTLGTKNQEEEFKMKRLSFIFVYSLVVPLFPTCYLIYETHAPKLREEIEDNPDSPRSSQLISNQLKAMKILISGLIPFQVWFECSFHIWRSVAVYPQLLLRMLPACRELDIPWKKQASLAFRSIQPLLVPMIVSLSCLAYPTVFKTASFRGTVRHYLMPTWIYLLVFSSPDVVFSATCVLAEVLLQQNLTLLQQATEQASSKFPFNSKRLLKEVRKRQSIHFVLCECVDKIERTYSNIYRFDGVVSLATIIIHGYLAFVCMVKSDHADSFAAFFRGFFCLLRIFYVIKAAVGPQIKSERKLKRISSMASEVESSEIREEITGFLVKTRLTPVRLIDTVFSGQHRSVFTQIVGAIMTSLVVLIQPFLDTSSLYGDRDTTGGSISDAFRQLIE